MTAKVAESGVETPKTNNQTYTTLVFLCENVNYMYKL